MALPLGNKRTCSHCSSRFYDLNKKQPDCPKCGKAYETPANAAPKRKRRKVSDRLMSEDDLLRGHMAATESVTIGSEEVEKENSPELHTVEGNTIEELE